MADRPDCDIDTWKPHLAQLMPIRLCDAIAGEEPPHLSCNTQPWQTGIAGYCLGLAGQCCKDERALVSPAGEGGA